MDQAQVVTQQGVYKWNQKTEERYKPMKGWEHVDRTDTGIQTGRRMTNRTEQTDKERGEDKD